MAGNKPPGQAGLDEMRNPNVRHERRDINVRSLIIFGVVFTAGGLATHFLIYFLFQYLNAQRAAGQPSPAPVIAGDARKLPPEPRLQSTPVLDLEQMRAAEQHVLDSYAWLDPARGVVRIPVKRAMELFAQEMAAKSAPPAPVSPNTVTVPTQSSLGPIVTQVGGPLSPNRVFPPDQPLILRGNGSPADGRQAGGPPTPPQFSLGRLPQATGK
ncbi:MAG: hypothetical protein ACE15B_09995 [Bryobacteraceae bacterium]